MMKGFVRGIGLGCVAVAMLVCGAAMAAPVSGVVTNRTTGRPSGGDDVVLLRLAQGMQELARTKTDAKGRFTIEVPDDGLHLLRVTHDKANYFKPVQPGASAPVDIDVYTASADVKGVSLDADVMRLQTLPGGNELRVVEHYFVKNDSSPAKTLMSDHPFVLHLPAGAVVEGAAAKAPGGMAVQSALVPMQEANEYTILFPLRPGESEFQVTYKLPYKGSFTFEPRPAMTTDTIAIMMPKSMTFKPGQSTPYSPVTEEMGAQTFVARNVQPSQPLQFTVIGTGELPRDAAAGTSASDASQGAGGPVNADPNSDTRPGGGLGVPVDKDAERDPLTKYRWWILGGGMLVLAAAAGLLMRRPAAGAGAGTGIGPEGALAVLRDEMFAVETDRLEGRLTEAQYAELKTAFDVVLRRTLARTGSGAAGTVQVVPE